MASRSEIWLGSLIEVLHCWPTCSTTLSEGPTTAGPLPPPWQEPFSCARTTRIGAILCRTASSKSHRSFTDCGPAPASASYEIGYNSGPIPGFLPECPERVRRRLGGLHNLISKSSGLPEPRSPRGRSMSTSVLTKSFARSSSMWYRLSGYPPPRCGRIQHLPTTTHSIQPNRYYPRHPTPTPHLHNPGLPFQHDLHRLVDEAMAFSHAGPKCGAQSTC